MNDQTCWSWEGNKEKGISPMQIHFLPSGQTIDVERGTSLHTAAEMAGIRLRSDCGNTGTCGKCKVIVNGNEQRACQTIVDTDLEVVVPEISCLATENNIAIVMLAAPGVPWVYNEFGRTKPAGLTATRIDLYARSLFRATKKAIGPAAGTGAAVRACPVAPNR